MGTEKPKQEIKPKVQNNAQIEKFEQSLENMDYAELSEIAKKANNKFKAERKKLADSRKKWTDLYKDSRTLSLTLNKQVKDNKIMPDVAVTQYKKYIAEK